MTHEIHIGLMGTNPDGDTGLVGGQEGMTDQFWNVWVNARDGDLIDLVEDHDFPLDQRDEAVAMAEALSAQYGAPYGEL